MRIDLIKRVVILVFSVLFVSLNSSAQKDTSTHVSVELYAVWPYGPLALGGKHFVSYGAGAEIAQSFKSFSVTSGLFFYTSKIVAPTGLMNAFPRETVRFNYFNVPFLVKIKLGRKQTLNQILLNTGLVLNIPRNYSSTFYDGNNSIINKTIASDYKTGASVRVGFQYNRMLNKKIKVIASSFLDYRAKPNYIYKSTTTMHSGPNGYIKDGFIFWGISLGIDLYLKENVQ